MLAKTFLFTLFIAIGYCDKARIDVLDKHGANGDENELITIDLQRMMKDGSEDIKLIVQLRFHLVKGMVHLNGTRLYHNIVNSVFMRLTVIEIKKGLHPIHKIVPVHLRILVLEKKAANGNNILFIEEEFVQVENYEVLQFDVKQIIWESMVRQPVSVISLKESRIHAMPHKSDVRILVKDDVLQPHHPDHGLEDDEHHYYHCHHHHHYHGNHTIYHHGLGSKAKCWYHHLSWKSKLSLFSIGFLSVITLVLCCALYAKRRRRRRTLEVNAPIDDSVSVDMDDVKKVSSKKDEKDDFHFELDNAVVVDDKLALVNE